MNTAGISFGWRRRTTNILIAGLVLVLVWLVAAYITSSFRPTVRVDLASGVYQLWVADTEASLEQGLSGVKSLPAFGGLLMRFDHDAKWGIWMKDMHFPIDIIWLDKDKKVVYIVKDAQPDDSSDRPVFMPKDDARYVLELPAGTVQAGGIKPGLVAQFSDNTKGGSQ